MLLTADASRRALIVHSPMTRGRRSLVAIGFAVAVIISGCGDATPGPADGGSTVASADASERAEPPVTSDEADEGLGAAGHWTAGQLCSLIEVGTVSAAFPGIEVLEKRGLDDADWSVCNWDDAAIDPLEPTSTLIRVANNDHDGETFCDCFDTIEVPGADQAVFAETLDSETRSAVLVAVADQTLTIEFPKADAGARQLAEQAATKWVSSQTA